jgi:hypothetical protein
MSFHHANSLCSYFISCTTKNKSRKSHNNMFNNQVSTYKTGGALTEKSLHPSEFGRVSAWVKRTKNDLALVKEMYGHPPPIVFDRPADKFIDLQDTTPQNKGMLTSKVQMERRRLNAT